MKTCVLGDIHGGYKALLQVIERSGFNPEQDMLIFLGDVCDGWSQTRECIDYLMQIPNLIFIRGNHDQWTIEVARGNASKKVEQAHYFQGGRETLESYGQNWSDMPESHLEFLELSVPYFVHENHLFIHAGIEPQTPLNEHEPQELMWSRTMAKSVLRAHSEDKKYSIDSEFDEIWIGHTPTMSQDRSNDKPIFHHGINLLDTGSAYDGKLTIVDLHTKEYYQSDRLRELYPHEAGRYGTSLYTEIGWEIKRQGKLVDNRHHYEKLKAQWLEETKNVSSATEMMKNTYYLAIVANGYHFLWYILEDFRKGDYHWLITVISEVTDINPTKYEHRGKLDAMAKDWVEWAKKYVW